MDYSKKKFCCGISDVNGFALFSVTRLEERESELKKEYTKLHDRYTEVLTIVLLYGLKSTG